VGNAGLPFDWQFLVVTAAALWGLWVLLRPFLTRLGKNQEEAGGAACPRCSASGSCASSAAKSGGSGSGLVTLGSGGRGKPAG
jgi:hypothetical protein